MLAYCLCIPALHRSGETVHTAVFQNLIYISCDERTQSSESAVLIKAALTQQHKTLLDQSDDLIAADGCRAVILYLILCTDQPHRVAEGRKKVFHILQMSPVSFNCKVGV